MQRKKKDQLPRAPSRVFVQVQFDGSRGGKEMLNSSRKNESDMYVCIYLSGEGGEHVPAM